jgi:uncharacterized glyoxalase superfamily protein PhnB
VSLDAIGIAVEDIERARAFYALLGLDVPADEQGFGHVEVTLAGGLRLMFDTHETMKSFDSSWSWKIGSTNASLAFAFETPDEVDAKHDELVAAGATSHLAPWDAFWGMRYAVLRDPDGNELSLYAQLPERGD